jgi:hypothetical protein
MALDAAHRSSIYQKLVPVLGEDDANVLMTEFPAHEQDELVTKEFLRAELATLEAKLTVRLGAMLAASTALMLTAFGLFT